MQFTTAILALAATTSALSLPRQLTSLTSAIPGLGSATGATDAASAVPDLSGMTTGDAAAKCGNGQVLSCCGSSASSGSQGSFLGGLGQGLIGGNCNQVPVNIIGGNGILLDQCHPNNAACCTSGENGLVNTPCVPISA